MLSKSLIQFSADGSGCALSLWFNLKQLSPGVCRLYDRDIGFMVGNGNFLQEHLCQHTDCYCQCPWLHGLSQASTRGSQTLRQVWLVSCEVTTPFPWVLEWTVLYPPRVSVSLFPLPIWQRAQMVKNQPSIQDTQALFLSWEDPLEKGMATHSSVFAWRIQWRNNLIGCSPWSHKESDRTEWLSLLTFICTWLLEKP